MKDYFYKVKYSTSPEVNRSHWAFGRFDNKNSVITASGGKAFEILTVKQLFEKHTPDEIRVIAKNCLVYQPNALSQFPVAVRDLLK